MYAARLESGGYSMAMQKRQFRKHIVLAVALALLFVIVLGSITGFAASYSAKKADDGNVYIYVDGKIDRSYNGIYKGNKYTMYFKGGILNTSFTGLVKNKDGKYLLFRNGYWKSSYTGIYKGNKYTMYITKGVLDKSFTGLVKNSKGNYLYFKNGYWKSSFTGLYKNAQGKWLYLKNGVWNSGFTGLYKNAQGQWLYVKNGVWNSGFTGLYKNAQGQWLYLKNGVWNSSFNGLYKNAQGQWLYLKNGIWDSGFNGLYKNAQGQWLDLKGGVWQSNFTGIYTSANNGKKFYISKGVWQSGFTGRYTAAGGIKYYVKGGVVAADYTGLYYDDAKEEFSYVEKGVFTGPETFSKPIVKQKDVKHLVPAYTVTYYDADGTEYIRTQFLPTFAEGDENVYTTLDALIARVREDFKKFEFYNVYNVALQSGNADIYSYFKERNVPYYAEYPSDFTTRSRFVEDLYRNTNDPSCGDYMYYNCSSKVSSFSCILTRIDGVVYGTVVNNSSVIPSTTIQQEQEMDAGIKKLLPTLYPANASDYTKVKAIYTWITQNVRYDYEGAASLSFFSISGTAYGAFHDRKAVCQGIACLMYKMCKMAGVDCRIADASNADHVFNAVKLSGKWYYCDATWDLGKAAGSWENFLKGTNAFHSNRAHNPIRIDCTVSASNYA